MAIKAPDFLWGRGLGCNLGPQPLSAWFIAPSRETRSQMLLISVSKFGGISKILKSEISKLRIIHVIMGFPVDVLEPMK